MTRRHICLHGHFYQPPRENPWIEEIEAQDSAHPYHDWNERIAAECYGPNGAARVKGHEGRILDIVDNYDLISFNFGPTLFSWLERARPDIYRAILDADARSVKARGHGNALAQAYAHPILPLCTPRDRRTQIRWGIADFRYRFRRAPEGFWLPETAVDLETLRDLAREGIAFTILSPYQARRVRPKGGLWQDAEGARFDPTRPYRVDLGEGLSIVVFFYDGPIARSFAFGGALDSPEELIQRLAAGFEPARGHDELLSVAIDGETFGHHKKRGDESLAAALKRIQAEGEWEIINFGQALDRFPAEWEVELLERTSWSCAHGIERWRSDCGCSTGGPGWHQRWRAPLRSALDKLRTRLDALFEKEASGFFRRPYEVRDLFIDLVLDPERTHAKELLDRWAGRPLLQAEATRALCLLEMSRDSLLMFTSCGWFFSEISGIETTQILKYAARAIQLAKQLVGIDLEPAFKADLAQAPSNLTEFGDGARVYDRLVKPSVVTMEQVAAHYAVSNLFPGVEETARGFCYRHAFESRRSETAGPATLAVGRLEIESLLTQEKLSATTCVLHFGGSDFRVGILSYVSVERHAEVERTLFDKLGELSLAHLVRTIDRVFPGRDYSLRDLFLDERRRLARQLLREVLKRHESDYTALFEEHRHLLEFLREIDSPIPPTLKIAADISLTLKMRQQLAAIADGQAVFADARAELFATAELGQRLRAQFEPLELKPLFGRLLAASVGRLEAGARDDGAVAEIEELVALAGAMTLPLDLSETQNRLWALLPARAGRARFDAATLARLGDRLGFDSGALARRQGG